jgi:ribonuclease III
MLSIGVLLCYYFLRESNPSCVAADLGSGVSFMDYSTLEAKIGYTFTDQSLLQNALTHSTFTYESPGRSVASNERLEFLGDCVLDLIVGDLLYRNTSDYTEGVMSKLRALIVCETTLTAVARECELGRYLRFGRGELLSGGMEKSSNLSSALEAVIAAVYLDGGYLAAYRVSARLLGESIDQAVNGELVYDYKSRLLELIQGIDKNAAVRFVIVREEGPDHHRTFYCEFHYNAIPVGHGVGQSKKEAEQDAAREGLLHIRRYCGPSSRTDPDSGPVPSK